MIVQPTHVFFDFFGTLVTYSPNRREQGYPRSHALLRDAGSPLEYAAFLDLWKGLSERFDEAADRTLREFSMVELGTEFMAEAIPGTRPDLDLVCAFVTTYLDEWNTGVSDIAGLSEVIGRLSRRFSLAVITNTHDASLVPAHLARMGIADHFEAVVTSVGFGARKPAVAIFEHALGICGAEAAASVYVGDNHAADYAGARGAQMRALLVDPQGRAPVPASDRLVSILDLEAALG